MPEVAFKTEMGTGVGPLDSPEGAGLSSVSLGPGQHEPATSVAPDRVGVGRGRAASFSPSAEGAGCQAELTLCRLDVAARPGWVRCGNIRPR